MADDLKLKLRIDADSSEAEAALDGVKSSLGGVGDAARQADADAASPLETLGGEAASAAERGLDRVGAAGGRAGKQAGDGLDRIADEARDATDATNGAGAALGGLAKAAAGIAAGAVTLDAIKDLATTLLDAGMRAQDLRSDLAFAAGGVEEADEVMRALRVTADDLGVRADELAQAWIRLKNLGLDPSREALEAYANVAAGNSGKSIMDFIEAVADASVGEFERLKEFGIKATVEGERVALSFKGTTVEIENDAKAIQDALRKIGETEFAGALEARAGNASTALDALNESVGRLTASLAEDSGLLGRTTSLAGALTELANAIEAPNQRAEQMSSTLGVMDTALKVASNPVGALIGQLDSMGVNAEGATKAIAWLVRDAKGLEEAAGESTDALKEHGDAVDGNTDALMSAEDVAKAYAKALSDLAAERQLELAAAERATEQLQSEIDLRVDHLQHLADEARARGDETEALRLEAQARDTAINGIGQLIAAKERELAAARASATARLDDAEAAGMEAQQIAALKGDLDAGIEARLREIETMREEMRHRQMLNDINNNVTDTTRNLSDSQRDLGNSAKDASDGVQRVVGSSNDLNIAFLNSREQIRNAIADLRGYSSAAADAVEEIVSGLDRWDNKIRAIQALEASDFVGDGAVDEASARIAQLEAELEATGATADALAERVDMAFNYLRDTDAVVLAITQLKQEVIEAEIAAERLAQRGERLQTEFSKLGEALDAGSIGLSEYADKLDRLIDANQRLGEEELEPLRAALDDARRKMADFTEEAQAGLRDLQAEWAELNGQQLEALLLEQEAQRLEIEMALAEAKRDGNTEAIRALEDQLDMLEQIQAVERERAAEAEAQAAIEAAEAEAEEAARRAALSDADRAHEDSIATLEARLLEAVRAQDQALEDALAAQIAAERQRHETTMANLEAESAARTSTDAASTTGTTSRATGSAASASRAIDVRVSVNGQSSRTITVADEASADALESILSSLESAAAVAI
ncbi:phage tail tape measure protein [Marichromatium gracile]|uniref:Uncharacterized protein n=1 Tax=Marichromatium gracile TaxID=1048 RepID=A0A4R4A4J7_MARGR|nr:phage tail tape measure protein [Marichromatium gracile]TCW32693.1 hypothetical protein EDC29_11759 [Marichromatium gracile]